MTDYQKPKLAVVKSPSLRIGLVGKMRSGKDSAAWYLKKTYGGTIFHVAQAVYDATEWVLLYRLVGKKIDPEKKTKFERLALQWVGRWGRVFLGRDIWLNRAIRTLDRIDGNVFVTGVRFPNEVDALQLRDIKVVLIDRPVEDRIAAGAYNLDHETETALDEVRRFDAIVKNDGSLDSFHTSLRRLVWRFRGGEQQ